MPRGNSSSIRFSRRFTTASVPSVPVGLRDTLQDLARQATRQRRPHERAHPFKDGSSQKDGHFPVDDTERILPFAIPNERDSVLPSRARNSSYGRASQAALKMTVWPSGAKRAEEMIPRRNVSR